MPVVLQPILEFLILLPGAILCFLPMRKYMRIPPKRLAALGIPSVLVACVLGGWLCYAMNWTTNTLVLPVLVLAGFGYSWVLELSPWKSVSVFLGACGAFSCLNGIAVVIDAVLAPGSSSPWFSLPAGALHNLLGWVMVGLAAYPAIHAVPGLLDDEILAPTWRIFWCVPVIFIGLNFFFVPHDQSLLYQGRTMQLYVVTSLVLLGLLFLLYLLFYRVARGMAAIGRLRRENEFLHMQSAQHDALQAAISETRQARHDLRHHFNALHALMARGAWEEAAAYLEQARASVPDARLALCGNPVIDGVAGHYAVLCDRNAIPLACDFELPRELPVAEMDLCVVLSNLMENAIEASVRTDPARRRISVRAAIRGDRLVLLTVENTYDGTVAEKDGVFQSSKREGEGVGLQSVRRIAEKNGGHFSVDCGDGLFRVRVMLRGAGVLSDKPRNPVESGCAK